MISSRCNIDDAVYCVSINLKTVVVSLNDNSISFFSFLEGRYCFILYGVVISFSPLSRRFPFSWFPVHSLLFTQKSLLFKPKSRATLVSTRGTAQGARKWGRGGSLGGLEASLASYEFLAGRAV